MELPEKIEHRCHRDRSRIKRCQQVPDICINRSHKTTGPLAHEQRDQYNHEHKLKQQSDYDPEKIRYLIKHDSKCAKAA